MTYAIEAEQLVKHYTGRGGDVEAVRGVDLHVRQGEVFGFLGPNGAGKSTTVRMLTTLMTLTSGSARVAGVDVTKDPDAARNRIGVALQEAGLDPRQTGRELVILQGRLFDMSHAEAAARSSSWSWSTSSTTRTAGSRGTPEACGAGWIWHRRSSTSRRSCSSTSRRRDSTRPAG